MVHQSVLLHQQHYKQVNIILILHSDSITDLTGNGNSLYTTTFTVSPINLAQMKDGLNRAQTFFNSNNRLPNYVNFGTTKISIAEFQQILATQGLQINTKITNPNPNTSLASIMRSAAPYGYSHSAHTAETMEKLGAGDCWAMSDYLFKKMTAAHMHARIITYATAYSANHRSVQYQQNGTWVNAPYKAYGLNKMFDNTQSTGRIIACS